MRGFFLSSLRTAGLALATAVTLAADEAGAQERGTTHRIASPDGRIEAVVHLDRRLEYSIAVDRRPLVVPSLFELVLDDGTIVGRGAAGSGSAVVYDVDEWLEPVVPEKASRVRDRFRTISIDVGGGWALEVRAYDDGVAMRYRTERAGPLTVVNEIFRVALAEDPELWLPTEEDFLTHSERRYERLRSPEVPEGQMASLPVLATWDRGPRLAITEADLRGYPGLYLAGTEGPELRGTLAAYPAEVEQVNDRTVRVVSREPWLARTAGPRTFPWRVFVVAHEDGDLVESPMVWRLAAPLRLADTDWIRPGKVAWDWWNALNLFGVEFEAGLNTETYLHYIDFAAEFGIEYVILDEGWSDPADLRVLNPELDLRALFARARERGVGLVPWVVWKSLDDRLEEALDRFEAWGAAGIKVDFMQRDDQPMVDFYWRVAEAAARRHLLVDFHGAYKPTGLRRAYPNVITREGVLGLEHAKWSPHPTPEHDVTLPFIRMLAGPMDYTPGAMRNATEDQFKPVFDRPMSLGTRAHQMAMYVVFESPLQMLADSPTHYRREAECTRFIVDVPTVWDETRVLAARLGDFLAVARRSGDSWFVGAMTDWEARSLTLELDFLEGGAWRAVAFADGPNAHRNPVDYRRHVLEIRPREPLEVRLAPGGGWVARLDRASDP